MVIIFLLVVFMLAQYFLSVALTGRDEALMRLNRQLTELADLLSLESQANAELRLDIAQLSAELQGSTATRDDLSAQLAGVLAERDKVSARLASVLTERDALDLRLKETAERAAADAAALRAALAEAERTIEADRDTIELRLAELASLRQDIAALRKVRTELEGQVGRLAMALEENREKLASIEGEASELRENNRVLVVQLGESGEALEQSRGEVAQLSEEGTALRDRTKALAARLSDEAERTALAQKEIEERESRLQEVRLAFKQSGDALTAERAQSARSQARIELLNQQIFALRQQLERLARALDVVETKASEQKLVITDLGRKLNLALAGKVEELQRYRSEFFGRLREVLGDRPGIRIEGDRFVFQSEVLFASGSAVLEDEGQSQMAQLAATLIEIAADIPGDVSWILRVDGHTDKVPIQTSRFPSNWELSTARAISVVRFLTDEGVPPERLAATGFGEFQPIDPRDDEIAYRRNRRIELKLTTR